MKIKIMLIKIKTYNNSKDTSKYNDRSRVAAKHTNRLRDTETGKHLGRKKKRHTSKYNHKQIYKWTHGQRQINKKLKMRRHVLLLLK